MSLFVPINEPADLRRELLNNSKGIISTLRRYEHYREIRKAKLEAFEELAKIWADVAKLQRKLKTALPKTDIRSAPIQKVHTIPAQKSVVQKPTVRQQRSKVDLLEEQLSKIENKLAGLQ